MGQVRHQRQCHLPGVSLSRQSTPHCTHADKSYVQTDMTSHAEPGEEHYQDIWKKMHAVDRFGTAKEFGDFITLICSERAGTFLTGSDIVMDGGGLC